MMGKGFKCTTYHEHGVVENFSQEQNENFLLPKKYKSRCIYHFTSKQSINLSSSLSLSPCINKKIQILMVNNIRIYHECEGRIEKSVPKIAVWHNEACRVMTNGDPRDGLFYPSLTRIMDYFSCSSLFFFILK